MVVAGPMSTRMRPFLSVGRVPPPGSSARRVTLRFFVEDGLVGAGVEDADGEGVRWWGLREGEGGGKEEEEQRGRDAEVG